MLPGGLETRIPCSGAVYHGSCEGGRGLDLDFSPSMEADSAWEKKRDDPARRVRKECISDMLTPWRIVLKYYLDRQTGYGILFSIYGYPCANILSTSQETNPRYNTATPIIKHYAS
jgi:hypothetical protein